MRTKFGGAVSTDSELPLEAKLRYCRRLLSLTVVSTAANGPTRLHSGRVRSDSGGSQPTSTLTRRHRDSAATHEGLHCDL